MRRIHKLGRINAEKLNEIKIIHEFSRNISTNNILMDCIVFISVLLGPNTKPDTQ